MKNLLASICLSGSSQISKRWRIRRLCAQLDTFQQAPLHHRFDKYGLSIKIKSYTTAPMEEHLRAWCLDLCKRNMLSFYLPVWGWNDKKKRKQLEHVSASQGSEPTPHSTNLPIWALPWFPVRFLLSDGGRWRDRDPDCICSVSVGLMARFDCIMLNLGFNTCHLCGLYSAGIFF